VGAYGGCAQLDIAGHLGDIGHRAGRCLDDGIVSVFSRGGLPDIASTARSDIAPHSAIAHRMAASRRVCCALPVSAAPAGSPAARLSRYRTPAPRVSARCAALPRLPSRAALRFSFLRVLRAATHLPAPLPLPLPRGSSGFGLHESICGTLAATLHLHHAHWLRTSTSAAARSISVSMSYRAGIFSSSNGGASAAWRHQSRRAISIGRAA
jgi:hypothetical protein